MTVIQADITHFHLFCGSGSGGRTPTSRSGSMKQHEIKPIAILHDDGCYTWIGPKPRGYDRAGWRMEVYAEPPKPQWQPIETAPLDGIYVLICDARYPDSPPLVARSHLGKWRGQQSRQGRAIVWPEATHWMPLPQQPEGKP